MAMPDEQNPALPFLVPPPPEVIIRNEHADSATAGGGEERVRETPERTAVRGEIDQLTSDHAAAVARKLEHDQAAADIEAQAKQAQVDLFDANQKAHADALRATQSGIDEWKTRLRESMANYDAAPAPKLFADKDTPHKVIGGIGLVLAGIGDAMGRAAAVRVGQSGSEWNTVTKIIESDLGRQRENIQRLSDRMVSAKTGLADAQAARQQLLAEVDQRGAVAFKRADLVAQARLAGQGKDAATIRAMLDQLGWRQKSVEMKESSVAPLVDHVNTTYSNQIGDTHSRTDNINKPQPGTKLPTHITDMLTGKDLPVDPTATDERQHNKSVAQLGPINTFLDTSNKLISATDAEGPARNELIAKVIGGDQTQAGRDAAVTRLRSAYAAAKGESVGEGNSKHLETAIPSPPSSLAPDGAWQAWRTKIAAVNEEMRQLRKENLAAAGVPRTAIETPETHATQAPAKTATPLMAPAAAPSASHVPAAAPRDRMIRLLRANPNRPNAALARKAFGISDADLK